jgi:hypothetical protein
MESKASHDGLERSSKLLKGSRNLAAPFQPAKNAALAAAVTAWLIGDETTNGNIKDWDTSLITGMNELFL